MIVKLKAMQRYFREDYAELRLAGSTVSDGEGTISEHMFQCIWYEQHFKDKLLTSQQGHSLQILSPGWWNRQEGPDFKHAQIIYNGKPYSGDVELHLESSGWKAHGHHVDPRYDQVILHVVLYTDKLKECAQTSEGRKIPTLFVEPILEKDVLVQAGAMSVDDYPLSGAPTQGACSALVLEKGPSSMLELLELTGEWRILNKARNLQARILRAGVNQVIYEEFMYACGYAPFKHIFRTIANSLPHDRVLQLSQQDPLLLETALLQIAGLLPDIQPGAGREYGHLTRLCGLRRDKLEGLRHLPLTWSRLGVRPTNNPERRLAGAARFLSRTTSPGLSASLEKIWRPVLPPLERRRLFEGLFPRAMGFWSTHCTWTGKEMQRATALLGPGRIRSIIGNVFIPVALALARQRKDRHREEVILEFFAALPGEPQNRILKTMVPRVFAGQKTGPLRFRHQQGMLQLHQDWCESNPACHQCLIFEYLRKRK
jgi:hypothetical protein